MTHPHDPRVPPPGNRLFRAAIEQSKRKPKFSWPLIGLAITLFFGTAGGAFIYFSQQGSAPAAAPAPAAAAPPETPAPATPTLTPTPTPTPSPTPRPRAKTDKGAKSTPRTLPAPPIKEVKPRRDIIESSTALPAPPEATADTAADDTAAKAAATPTPAVKTAKPVKSVKAATEKTAAKPAPGDKKTAEKAKTAVKSADANAAATKKNGKTRTGESTEQTLVVPVGAGAEDAAATAGGGGAANDGTPASVPLARPKFSMRPESERSGNTDRVVRTEEFPPMPGTPGAAPTPATSRPAGAAVPAVPLGGAGQ